MADYPTFTVTPRMAGKNWLTTDSTNALNIVTGGDNGTRVTSLVLHNKPTTAREAYVALTNGTATYRLAAVSVNNTGNTTQDLLAGVALPEDSHNNSYVALPDNTWTIAVSLNAAVASDNDVSVVSFGGDY